MKLIKNGLSLIVLTILLFGCLDYKEKMKLNSDLSGELTFSIGISEQLLSFGNKSPELEEFDESKLKENYSAKKGIKFVSSRSYNESGNRWIELKLKFENIDDLMRANEESEKQDMIGKISITKDEEGNFVFSRELVGNGIPPDTTSDEFSKNIADMMFGNYTWKYELILPGKVISSNADTVLQNTNTVQWSIPLSSISNQKVMTVTFTKGQFLDVAKTIAAIVIVIAFAIFIYQVLKKRKLRR